MLLVEHDVGVPRSLRDVERDVVRGRGPGKRLRGKSHSGLLGQLTCGCCIRRLARPASARGRGPGPIAVEVGASRGQPMKDEELTTLRAFSPDDDAARKRPLTRDRLSVPG